MKSFYIIVSYEKWPAGAVWRQRQKSWWSVRVRCSFNTAFYLAQNTNHNVKNRSGDRELSKTYMCYKVQREGWPKPQPDSFVLARRIVKIKCILNIVFKKIIQEIHFLYVLPRLKALTRFHWLENALISLIS